MRRSWTPSVLVACLLVAMAVGPARRGEPRLEPAAHVPVGPESPCGASVSVGTVRSRASFFVATPDHPSANDRNVSRAYVCSPSKVWVGYASGISLLLEPWTVLADPATVFDRMAEGDRRSLSVTADGVPVLVVDPSADPTGRTPGGVSLVKDGLLIEVSGNGRIPLGDLIAVTESLSEASRSLVQRPPSV